ncbi:S8 family peptidase [Streptomyces boninensis]|uniref:S8 family peptidase n=1 Tax=Streptomyces boninensis TaxID=2039455 RepID=UPI003B212A8F
MKRVQVKRSLAAITAVTAAVAVTAGLTSADVGPAFAAEKAAPAAGQGRAQQWVTLLTGDRIGVDAKGNAVSVRPGEGRAKIPVQLQKVKGHSYAIPLDAGRLIANGTLDRRLFDVTTLSRPEYVRAQAKSLGVIVAYQGKTPAAEADLKAAPGTAVKRKLPAIGAEAVRVNKSDAGASWAALTRGPADSPAPKAAASGVKRIWLDAVRKASLDKSVPQIGAPAAWKAGYDGKGIKIGVLDTGVDATHPDLAGQVVAEKNFSDSPDAKDRYGHGTHVASIAAGTGKESGGKYKGVAPGAKLIAGKVLNDDGYGEDSGIIAAAEWAVGEGADVINFSLGGTDTPELDPLEAAVNALSKDKGVLFAVAAGNEGELGNGTIGSPGSADAALTVGAVDDKDKIAEFSSRGPRVGDLAVKPDLTAPGVDITAAAAPGSVIEQEVGQKPPGYLTISGTSMATPHVAGAAALLAQQHPDWTGAELKGALTASTKAGTYTAIQQGSGRVDVAKAIKQTVYADPVSVSFGQQLWPHGDDKPVSKPVTYRNTGKKDVTLKLAVSGLDPKGKAAPAGMFKLNKKTVTVPAGGTAEAALTADTRLGGSVNGFYSAYITATGGGQTVRTAGGVEREVESYEVTFKNLDRDGKPTAGFETTLFAYEGGPTGGGPFGGFIDLPQKETVTVRLPKGRYAMSALLPVASGEDEPWKGGDWLGAPNINVSKKQTVTLDARTAKPVDITVPDKEAEATFAAPDFHVHGKNGGIGFGIWMDSYAGFSSGHVGAADTTGTLFQQFPAFFQKGKDGPEYQLAYGMKGTKLATGFTRHLGKGDLAKVTAVLGSSATGKTGYLSAMPRVPGASGGSSVSYQRKLPFTSEVYLGGSKGVQWGLEFEQNVPGDDGFPEQQAWYYIPVKAYAAGKSYEKTFNVGVFGPKLNSSQGLYRTGNTLTPTVPLFADGKNHTGSSLYDKATTTLYRNGKKLASSKEPPFGELSFKLPSGKAKYTLTATVDRAASKVAAVSPKVTSSWSFTSAKTSKKTKLPASAVRFSPDLAPDSTATAGKTLTVPVTVQGAAAGSGLKSLTVYASYDGGRSWSKLTVKKGAVQVKTPAAGKTVSFKAKATDKKGGSLTQTIYGAYVAK